MSFEPDEEWERSLRHLDVDDLSLIATALEEKDGNWQPGVGFRWQDTRAEELWFVICMLLEVDGNRPVWQQTHVFPIGDKRWWASCSPSGERDAGPQDAVRGVAEEEPQ